MFHDTLAPFAERRIIKMQYYVSDLHFGHEASLNYNNRPFTDVNEMDQHIIDAWNSRVSRTDHVYILGDVCYRNEKPEEWYLEQLKGHLHLIIGNHDGKLLKNKRAMGRFQSVEKMMHVSDNKRHICLCHFPIAEWNGFYKGHWHIYGHIHNRTDGAYQYMRNFDKALNAGVDINNYMPVTFDELITNNKLFRENL